MNTQNLTVEYQLLLACARKIVSPQVAQKIKKLAANSNIDWQQLIEIAAQHKLTPLLNLNLKLYAKEFVPDANKTQLQNKVTKISTSNLIFTAELINIINILKQSAITAIPFKGPTLASLIYDDIALRQYGDLDIFIPKSQFLQARKILLKNGYKAEIDLEHIDFDLLANNSRHDILITPCGITLELHWRIENVESRFDKAQAQQLLYQNIITIQLDDFTIPSFSIENLMLFLIMHCANHRYGYLSLLCDVADLGRKFPNINWREIVTKVGTLQLKKVTATIFYLLNNLLDFELPKAIKTLIAETKGIPEFANFIAKKFLLSTTPISQLTKMRFEAMKTDHLSKGIKEVLSAMTHPTGTEFKLKLPKKLAFLYFVMRPVLLVKGILSKIMVKDS